VNPELVACGACGAIADEPCHDLNKTITENGVTRRAVHADRKAASLPPKERAAFWAEAVDRYFEENPAER
jgi:hypothetical protein